MISPFKKSKSLNVLGISIFCSVLVLGTWMFAQADGTTITMCVKNSGDSYVIGTGFAHQSCKNNEQLLSFNVTGPQGPQGIQGPVGPQGPEGVGGAKVYDANNQVIGYVVDVESYFPYGRFSMIDKQSGVLQSVSSLTTIGVLNNLGHYSNLYYSSSDCSGQPYMSTQNSEYSVDLIRSTLIQGPSSNHFVMDTTIPTINSLEYNSYDNDSCTVESGNTSVALPVRNVQNVIDSYTRPFHIGL